MSDSEVLTEVTAHDGKDKQFEAILTSLDQFRKENDRVLVQIGRRIRNLEECLTPRWPRSRKHMGENASTQRLD